MVLVLLKSPCCGHRLMCALAVQGHAYGILQLQVVEDGGETFRCAPAAWMALGRWLTAFIRFV